MNIILDEPLRPDVEVFFMHILIMLSCLLLNLFKAFHQEKFLCVHICNHTNIFFAIQHNPDEIRPTFDGDQPGFEIAYDDDPAPSVTIDIDIPGYSNSAIGVDSVIITGNVASVTIYIKVS